MQIHSFPFCSNRYIQQIGTGQIIPIALSILATASLTIALFGVFSYLPPSATGTCFSSFFIFSVMASILLFRKKQELGRLQSVEIPKRVKTAVELLFEALEQKDNDRIIALLLGKSEEYKPKILEIMQFAFKIECEDKILKYLLRFSSCEDFFTFPKPEKEIILESKLTVQEFEDQAPLTHFAAANGYREAIALLSLCGKLDLNEEWMGRTPLSYAVIQGNIELIRLAFSCSDFLNDKTRVSLLKLAVIRCNYYGTFDAIETLVQPDENVKGISVDIPDEEGKTALHWAVTTKNIRALLNLQKLHANPYLRANDGTTPFVLAAKHGKDFERELFYKHTFQWKNQPAYSFFDWESGLDQTAFESFKNRFSTYGSACLAYACTINDVDAVSELLKLGISPNFRMQGKTLLFFAAQKGNREVIKLLIQAGALSTIDDLIGFPSQVTAQEGLKAIMECLGNQTPYVIKQWNLNELLLHVAKTPDFIGFAEKLIQLGADVNYQTKEKISPVHEAASVNNAEFIKILSKHGANLDSRIIHQGMTALYLAHLKGNKEAFKVLLECGADPNVRVNDTHILCEACRLCQKEIVTLLLITESLNFRHATNSYGLRFFTMMNERDLTWIKVAAELPEKTKIRILNAYDVKRNLESFGLEVFIHNNFPFMITLVASTPGFETLIVKTFPFLSSQNEKIAILLLFRALQQRDEAQVLSLLLEKKEEYKLKMLQIIQYAFKINCKDKILKHLLKFSSCEDFSTFPKSEKEITLQSGLSVQEFEDKAPLSHFAAAYGYLEAMSLLWLCGKLDLKEEWRGCTPLYYPIFQENVDFIKATLFLYRRGLNNQVGASLLKLAVTRANDLSLKPIEVLKALIQPHEKVKGISVDVQDEEGKTALHWAAITNKICAFEYLQKLHANPYLRANDGKTPFVLAQEHGKDFELGRLSNHTFEYKGSLISFLNWLLRKRSGASIDSFDERFPTYGSACLAYASSINDHEVVSELLKLGFSPGVAEKNGGLTPLHYAARNGHLEILKCLIQAGAGLPCNYLEKTPLTEASLEGLKAIFEAVTHLKPEEVKQGILDTLLWQAAQMPDFLEYVEKLIQLGGNVNFQNEEKVSLIHLAAEENNAAFISILFQHKADLNLRNNKGAVALYSAFIPNNKEAFALLLECGADPNVKVDNSLILHMACEQGLTEMVTLLLNRESVDLKANVDGRVFFEMMNVAEDKKWIPLAADLPEKTKIRILNAFDVKSNLESASVEILIRRIHPLLIALAASIPDLEKLVEKSFRFLEARPLSWVLPTWERVNPSEKLFQFLSSAPSFMVKGFPALSLELRKDFAKRFQGMILIDLIKFTEVNTEKKLGDLRTRISKSSVVSLEDKRELLDIRAQLDHLDLVCGEAARGNFKDIVDKKFNETLALKHQTLMVMLKEIGSLLKVVEQKSPKNDFVENPDEDFFIYFHELDIKDPDLNPEQNYLKKLGVSSQGVFQRGIQEVRDLYILGISGSFGFLIQEARNAIHSESLSKAKAAIGTLLEWKAQEIEDLEDLEKVLKEVHGTADILSTFIAKLNEFEDACKDIKDENFDCRKLDVYLRELFLLDKKRKIFCIKAYLNQPNMDKIPTEILKGSSLSDYAMEHNKYFTFYYHLKKETESKTES